MWPAPFLLLGRADIREIWIWRWRFLWRIIIELHVPEVLRLIEAKQLRMAGRHGSIIGIGVSIIGSLHHHKHWQWSEQHD